MNWLYLLYVEWLKFACFIYIYFLYNVTSSRGFDWFITPGQFIFDVNKPYCGIYVLESWISNNIFVKLNFNK